MANENRNPARKRPAVTRPGRVPDDGVVRVFWERRRGGVVSLVTGVEPGEADAIAKELKRLCGSGGTVKNGVVEIQGDHRERIVAYFEARGRRVKKAGG